MAAANAALPWPDGPHLALWHAQTVLREFRGDGHVAALLTAGLDPCETLVLFAADNDVDATWLQQRRGWSAGEWADAVDRLAGRGLVDAAGALTPSGHALRRAVESRTDELSDAPWVALGDASAERLVELVGPWVADLVEGGAFLAANPMALRPLAS